MRSGILRRKPHKSLGLYFPLEAPLAMSRSVFLACSFSWCSFSACAGEAIPSELCSVLPFQRLDRGSPTGCVPNSEQNLISWSNLSFLWHTYADSLYGWAHLSGRRTRNPHGLRP